VPRPALPLLAQLVEIQHDLVAGGTRAVEGEPPCYLVLAHHGKLRVQVRQPDDAEPGVLLGLEQNATQPVSALLGQPGGELTVDLDQFTLGGDRSWTRTALALRDRYGPFVLAYLETVVRVADWRASGGMEVPE
jgi:CRISPR-associated endonuclease/helicase Cas3